MLLHQSKEHILAFELDGNDDDDDDDDDYDEH
jgi:hypothetical protein